MYFDQNVFTVDGANNRVGIASTQPTTTLDVGGTVTATAFVGDGANLTGVSGFAMFTLSSDSSSPLNRIFKTPKQLDIGAGTSIKVESDTPSGEAFFMRESVVHVAVGSTFHVGSGTTLITNVLGVF